MATNFRQAAFDVVWDALDGNITGLTLYDHVPTEPSGSPVANKPYGVLENTDTTPWEDDDKQGVFAEMTLHIFSDQLGRTQADTILDSAYALLNRASLTKTGYTVVDCLFMFSEVFVMEDGKTRHGIQRWRLTIQEA